MKKAIILAALLPISVVHTYSFASVNPPNDDTTITILMVKNPNVSESIVSNYRNFLIDTWNGTTLNIPVSSSNPITITFANAGSSVPHFDPLGRTLTGPDDGQITKLKNFAKLPYLESNPSVSIRDRYAADIIIGFTNSLSSGG